MLTNKNALVKFRQSNTLTTRRIKNVEYFLIGKNSMPVLLQFNFLRYKLVEGEGRNTTLKVDFLTTSYNPEAIFIHLFLDLKVSFMDPPI
jgi:hypothetical protein